MNKIQKNLSKLKRKCWRLLSEKIRRERGNKCQFPGCDNTTGLNVHHIEDARLNPSLFFDEKNLVVLCVKKHHKFSKEAIHRSGISAWVVILNVVGLPDLAYLMHKKYEEFQFTEEYLKNKLKELQDNSNADERMGSKKQRKIKKITS